MQAQTIDAHQYAQPLQSPPYAVQPVARPARAGAASSPLTRAALAAAGVVLPVLAVLSFVAAGGLSRQAGELRYCFRDVDELAAMCNADSSHAFEYERPNAGFAVGMLALGGLVLAAGGVAACAACCCSPRRREVYTDLGQL